jgi:hypothetical protein|tara:strand:+ start:3892 stop:4194 length:303 start_codon:yes stop_codon:yes gene_type:complete
MKTALFALPLLLATTIAPAIAQDDHSGHEAAAYTLETPIETLMANETTKAIVLAELPGLDEHPAYSQFKALSLKAVQPFSQGMITDETLAKISAKLAEAK